MFTDTLSDTVDSGQEEPIKLSLCREYRFWGPSEERAVCLSPVDVLLEDDNQLAGS